MVIEKKIPSYLNIEEDDFKKRINLLWDNLRSCTLCPRNCNVDRLSGETGGCRADSRLFISSYNLHFGEEPPISGVRGSGTIFFSHCLSRCVYCQNYPISQMGYGNEYSVGDLTEMMVYLQKKGAHNINFVTPTHYIPHIVKAIYIARKKGLSIPIVYNTFGYESIEILKMLDGIVDIYLPDMRYSENKFAAKFSAVANYVEINRAAIKEMFRQVGNLITKDGIAKKGVIVRLLVLPNRISGTIDTLNFLKQEVSPDIYISFMDQYFPAYKVKKYDLLNRTITIEEYKEVLAVAKDFNGWIQKTRSYQ